MIPMIDVASVPDTRSVIVLVVSAFPLFPIADACPLFPAALFTLMLQPATGP